MTWGDAGGGAERIKMSRAFVKYLLITSVGGGVLGVLHGAPAGGDAPALHGITGAILGPWAPIFVPLWVAGVVPAGETKRCPIIQQLA
jgi:hypothetical protein